MALSCSISLFSQVFNKLIIKAEKIKDYVQQKQEVKNIDILHTCIHIYVYIFKYIGIYIHLLNDHLIIF